MDEVQERIAVFVDFDNQKVNPFSLLNMLSERGKVVIRRGYADWVESQPYRAMASKAGFELIDCPKLGGSHKNSTDVRLTLDCLETCYEHPEIEVFVIVSADADFAPLVNKLRMKGRQTIIVAKSDSVAELLKHACDEFIPSSRLERLEEVEVEDVATKSGALQLYKRAIEAISRMGRDLQSVNQSYIKQVMLQMNPSFDEGDLGFKSFTDFCRWASSALNQYGLSDVCPQYQQPVASQRVVPQHLLAKAYNSALKEAGFPVSLQNIEIAALRDHPDFSPAKYGYGSMAEIAKAAAEIGLWSFDGGQVRMTPRQRISRTLHMTNSDQGYDVRLKVLEALLEEVNSWDEDPNSMSLKEIKNRVKDRLAGEVPSNDISGILRRSMRGGAFVSLEGGPLTSWTLPFKLLGGLELLQEKTLEGYLYVLVSSCTLYEDEIEVVAEILLREGESYAIIERLNALEQQGKIKKGRKRWEGVVALEEEPLAADE